MSPSELRALQSIAACGPAFSALAARGDIDWDRWQSAATRLQMELPDLPGRERRIHHLYVPVLMWLADAIQNAAHRPVIAGLSAPQGAGKSTLVKHVLPLLADLGLRAAAVSIDDFYLTHVDQLRLAAAHPGNPYLLYRGYPGTHDVALGAATLNGLRALNQEGAIRLPSYDKSLFEGRGDRLPRELWPAVRGPLDVAIVEGWMLGFRPRETQALSDPLLRPVNTALEPYASWHELIDVMVVLQMKDTDQIVRWRVEAEEAVRQSGRPALDTAAAEDYARRFVPAYELYADTVASGQWSPDRQLVLSLAADRIPS